MNPIHLTGEMLTGIAVIDQQHQDWLARYSAVLRAVGEGLPPEEVARTLAFLVSYAEEHFNTEEKYMTDQAYPGLREHKRDHDKLFEALSEILDHYRLGGATAEVTGKLEEFLNSWLARHIQKMDKAMALFLIKKGLTPV